MKEYKITCKKCGTVFYTWNPNSKYCEESCRPKHDRNDRKIICLNCKKEYYTIREKTKFCSKHCNYEYKKSNGLLKRYNQAYLAIRFKIFSRDNFRCKYCGRNPKEDNITLQIDHIIPKNKGGKYNFDNLITSCRECNLGKTDILLEEHNLRLIIPK